MFSEAAMLTYHKITHLLKLRKHILNTGLEEWLLTNNSITSGMTNILRFILVQGSTPPTVFQEAAMLTYHKLTHLLKLTNHI